MKRFLTAALAALLCFGSAGCGQSKAPLALENASSAVEDQGDASPNNVYTPGTYIASQPEPQTALDEIYVAVKDRYPLMELEDVTDDALLSALYGINAADLESYHIRRSNGKFGISDVLILQPKEGKMDSMQESLVKVQNILLRQVENYDVYDAVEIANQSLVYQQGDYLVLLALKDNITAREIIDKYIPN